jgi:flagellar biosynthesis protein FlhF
MRIRKFVAGDVREALTKIKEELGPDAMVVATRQVRRGLLGTGVEVTAAVDVDTPETEPASPASPGSPAPVISEADVERILLPLRSELRSLRALYKPAEPDLELRGMIASLSRDLASWRREPAHSPHELAARATITAPSLRRVIALIGPTGVGKTTTIAKLAARAALVDRQSVAIVTLDGYRVGGEEQMRAFAGMIGVPLRFVPEPSGLRDAVASLADYGKIYVDTAGRSPRDAGSIAELESALAPLTGDPSTEPEIHLTLPASASEKQIDSWYHRCRRLDPARLLFTKVDEGDDLAQMVAAPARLGRPVTWFTTGQRVPEDIEDASTARLIELAEAGFIHTEVAA